MTRTSPHLLSLVCLSLALFVSSVASLNDPEPRPGARYDLVIGASGPQLRVTVLTGSLLRVQYSAQNPYELHDFPTTAVVNRKFPLVKDVQASSSDQVFHLETDQFVFEYDTSKPHWPDGFRKLALKSTSLRNLDEKGPKLVKEIRREIDTSKPDDISRAPGAAQLSSPDFEYGYWHPSAPYAGNLLGTIRTLDGFDAEAGNRLSLNCTQNSVEQNQESHCRFGVLSRSGIALLDDSDMPVYPKYTLQPEKNPCQDVRAGTCKDLYFFAHGKNFTAALKDFRGLSGPAPAPPRWAFGIWFTRWYDFDDQGTRDLVQRHEISKVPLDVWVYDMNWHVYGQWGSYSWNRNILPEPEKLVGGWMQGEKGLKVGLNLHDGGQSFQDLGGVCSDEDHFAAFCTEVPDQCAATPNQVPFQPANATYLQAVEKTLIAPLGNDVAWIDYQQGETKAVQPVPNLNPTVMLNRVRSEFKYGTKNKRIILSRFPGIGGHRYPVGFSGDQTHTWANLMYLTYFTSTAANVGFGYWSHDIYGGTREGSSPPPSKDWELNTRWIQYGALSPIFRMHDKGEAAGPCVDTDTCSKVEIWDHPKPYYEAEAEVMRFRGALVPYLYTKAVEAETSGVPIVTPLYYQSANDPKAYEFAKPGGGYYLGADLLAYPVLEKADSKTLMTKKTIWLPPATEDKNMPGILNRPALPSWFDRMNGKLEKGGQTLTRQFTLAEYGLFQSVDAVIPLFNRGEKQTVGGASAERMDDVTWQVVVPPSTVSTVERANTTAQPRTYTGYFVEEAAATSTEKEHRTRVSFSVTWSPDSKQATVHVSEQSLEKNGDEDATAASVLDDDESTEGIKHLQFFAAAATGVRGILAKLLGQHSPSARHAQGEIDSAASGAAPDQKLPSMPARRLGAPRRHRIELLNFGGEVMASMPLAPDDKTKNCSPACETKSAASTWNQRTASTTIDLRAVMEQVVGKTKADISDFSVTLHLDKGAILDGLRGASWKARKAKELLDDGNVNYALDNRGRLADACTTSARMGYNKGSESPAALMAGFWPALREGRAQIADPKLSIANLRRNQALALIDEALRLDPGAVLLSDEDKSTTPTTEQQLYA
ncbi:unnamed protein product [Amoebophrya sp. A120]|nr:unnamed protein product [Amoebophrya sp. A120]|eukprot:GSA120T00005164001.1